VYLAFPEGAEHVRNETTAQSDAGAALLVSAEVPAWRRVSTDRPIRFDELDEEIARLAAAAGMSVDARFPFLLEGDFEDLQWHVIDGRRLAGGGTSHEDHLRAAVKGSLDRAAARLVGFYSPRDQGVFTHMGSRTHIHCVVDDPLCTGHVDHVVVPSGTVIRFPLGGDERPN
jgi:acetolactate decarboxylase